MSSHVLSTLVLCSTVAYQLYRVKLDCNIVWLGVSGPSHRLVFSDYITYIFTLHHSTVHCYIRLNYC